MKEIKAYVHRSRIADVIAAVQGTSAWTTGRGSDSHNLAVYLVKGSLLPVDATELRYSLELGEEMVNEYKVELLCGDSEVDELVAALVEAGRTGQAVGGWITVSPIERIVRIR